MLSTPFAAEIVAGAGFNWLLLDTEHSPSDVPTVMGQLQALSGYPGLSPVVRPAWNDAALIKRYLDIGAQTLLIPYVQSAEEAARAVAVVRYPPAGIRGVSLLTRATQFGRIAGYGKTANAEICLIVQIETSESIDALDEIMSVDGVDAVFVGPADLAASMGHIGEPGHPEVKAIVEDVFRRIVAGGKPAGILTSDEEFARRCIVAGTTFTAVDVDVALLARSAESLAARFRP